MIDELFDRNVAWALGKTASDQGAVTPSRLLPE
jgi:hypothetical protein